MAKTQYFTLPRAAFSDNTTPLLGGSSHRQDERGEYIESHYYFFSTPRVPMSVAVLRIFSLISSVLGFMAMIGLYIIFENSPYWFRLYFKEFPQSVKILGFLLIFNFLVASLYIYNMRTSPAIASSSLFFFSYLVDISLSILLFVIAAHLISQEALKLKIEDLKPFIDEFKYSAFKTLSLGGGILAISCGIAQLMVALLRSIAALTCGNMGW